MKIRKAIVIMVVFLSLALLHLGIYTQVIRLNYEINDLNHQFEKLRSENRELYNQIARLSSLDRIERIATTQLGMVKPDKVNFVWPRK